MRYTVSEREAEVPGGLPTGVPPLITLCHLCGRFPYSGSRGYTETHIYLSHEKMKGALL